MPIYEYECPDCGVVEALQGINDNPLTKCPECNKRKVKKLISESSFHLKGSGWYVTDYGKGNGKDCAAKHNGNGNGNGNGEHKEKKTEAAASDSSSSSPAKESTAKESSASTAPAGA